MEKEDVMLSIVRIALHRLNNMLDGDEGQTMAEYSLILAFIAASSVVVVVALAVAVASLYDDLISVMP